MILDGHELHPITRLEERRRFASGVEHLQRRAADELPAAWRRPWVYTGLSSGNADAACGNPRPWRRLARRGNRFVNDPHVGKARKKSEHEHAVLWRGVPIDDRAGR